VCFPLWRVSPDAVSETALETKSLEN